MAASRNPKSKVVTKDDLKRFMKERQSQVKSSSKKIDHPLAKYNSLNQLVCVLCSNVIKNDLLWPAHIQSKQHKERALALKTQGPAKPEHLLLPSGKRKTDDVVQKNIKQQKVSTPPDKSKGLPSDFFDDDSQNKKEVRERAKAALLAGYSSSSSSEEESSDDEENISDNKPATQPDSTSAASKIGLPADFFDPGNEPSGSDNFKEPTLNKKMSEILPEGFFDDPKMDAKVRKVEYKDKMDEEWDLFKKAMKEEALVSEVIIEEEDEQANIDRNIDEIDDQMHRWQEVEKLHVKKETILKSSKGEGQKTSDSGDEVEEEELNDFLDWRAKKVLK